MSELMKIKSVLTAKLLFAVFIVSTIVTLATTILQLVYNYRNDVHFLNAQLQQVEKSNSSSLAKSLWEMNEESLRIHAEGILKMPGISYLKVFEKDKLYYQGGTEPEEESPNLVIPLVYTDQYKTENIGSIIVYADIEYAISRIRAMILEIFLTQLLRVLAVSTLIFYVIQRIITKPVLKIIEHLNAINLDSDIGNLKIREGSLIFDRVPDELDEMVSVVNNLTMKLRESYQQLSDFNRNLELKILGRTQELIKAQEILTQQQSVLATTSKLSALGEMAGGLAHEINNPLAIISLKCQQLSRLIAAGAFKPQEFLSHVNVVRATVERTSKIIRSLRVFARDGSEDPMSSVFVNEIVDSTLSFCQEKLKNSGVNLIFDSEASKEIKIECRPTEISQILLNLINNSFDAVEKLKEKWIKINIKEIDSLVRIEVIDSGQGISESVKNKLMQPFFTTKEPGKGTGLGLSISLGIAKAHDGKLSIDDKNSNTCFILEIPKEQSKGNGQFA